MKKMIFVSFLLIIVFIFSACGQKTETAVNEKSSLSNDAYGAGGALSVSETDSMTDKEKDTSAAYSAGASAGADEAETATAVPVAGDSVTGVYLPEADVYVGRFEQDSLGVRLSAADAEKICGIIGRYKMDQFSWDNISDYTIVVNGVYYSYDSSSGIITKDDSHADEFSESDRREFNKTIGVTEADANETLASDADTVTDTFIVEKAAGTHLELRKADGGDTALYACDYGRLDGADEMKFGEGDQVVIRYDREVMETWPVQMTVREIYPAEWNICSGVELR